MFLVDSHCHVDGLDYEKEHQNLAEVIDKAQARDVRFMLAVSTTLSAFPALQQLTIDFPQVALSCGVHPLNLDDDWNIERLHALASNPKVVALGRLGWIIFTIRRLICGQFSNKRFVIIFMWRVNLISQ